MLPLLRSAVEATGHLGPSRCQTGRYAGVRTGPLPWSGAGQALRCRGDGSRRHRPGRGSCACLPPGRVQAASLLAVRHADGARARPPQVPGVRLHRALLRVV